MTFQNRSINFSSICPRLAVISMSNYASPKLTLFEVIRVGLLCRRCYKSKWRSRIPIGLLSEPWIRVPATALCSSRNILYQDIRTNWHRPTHPFIPPESINGAPPPAWFVAGTSLCRAAGKAVWSNMTREFSSSVIALNAPLLTIAYLAPFGHITIHNAADKTIYIAISKGRLCSGVVGLKGARKRNDTVQTPLINWLTMISTNLFER